MSLHQDPTQTAVRRQKRSLWTDAWRRMRRSHTAVIGMILFALIVIVCFSAPLFSDYDAQVINSDLAMIRKYPVEGHPLGTDELGRDLLLRILCGGRDHHDFHAFLHWAWRTAARAGMGFHAGGRTAVYP